jgi:hypothetical protein
MERKRILKMNFIRPNFCQRSTRESSSKNAINLYNEIRLHLSLDSKHRHGL